MIRLSISATILKNIGRMVPTWLPHGTAIGNRILKPLYRLFNGTKLERFDLWDGKSMKADPTDCVGGNLFFHPHLYDRNERKWVAKYLPPDGVFLDIGANIGAYTLWASKYLSDSGTILAVDADPLTFGILEENIRLNDIGAKCIAENIGLSDNKSSIPFFRNESNSGGNTFYVTDSDSSKKHDVILDVDTLYAVLEKHEINL